MLLRIAALSLTLIPCGFAQAPCPSINLLEARTLSLRPTSNTHIDVVRQNDGSYIGFEAADASPHRLIATVPHFEQQFDLCVPHVLPSKPGPGPAENSIGAGSQLQVSTRLASGNVFAGTIGNSTTVDFDIFDSGHNLLSESTFSHQIPVESGSRADEFLGLTMADMNGDGNLDLVAVFTTNRIAASIEGGVWIFPGNGDGTFNAGTRYVFATNGTLPAAMTVAVADVNGDGRPDIVFGHPYGTGGSLAGPMIVAIANADGTFSTVTTAIQSVESLALADLNGDKTPDLIAVTNAMNSPVLTVVMGDRSGAFAQQAQTFPATFTQSSVGGAMVAVGDLNGDGIPDIATSGGTVLFGDGKGGFPTRADYASNASGSVMIGDVDGDGIPDLTYGNGNPAFLSGNATDQNVTVLFGQGHGIFAGAPITQLGTSPGSFAIADFNGDGRADVVYVNATTNSTQVNFLAGTGDARFMAPKSQTFPYLASHGATQAISGDFNHDGKQDIVVFPGRDAPIPIYLGNGDGTFTAASSLTLPDPDLMQIGTADFNGDGTPDLIAWGSGMIYVCLSNGDGTFGQPVFSLKANSPAVAWGDFNDDGKLDLAIATAGGSSLGLYFGRGDGTFSPSTLPVTLPTSAIGGSLPDLTGSPLVANTIAVGDFDRDGQLDVAVLVGPGSGSTPLYLTAVISGTGDGRFNRLHFVPGLFYGAVPVDVNKDGILDLVGYRDTFPETRNTTGSGISIRLGNGDGTFQPDFLVAPQGVPNLGDLNHDGLVDLAVSIPNGAATFLNLSQSMPLTVVSGASFASGPLAPNTFAAAFGAGLTATNNSPAVLVQDSAGTVRLADVSFASASQINFRVPPDTATGTATVRVAGSPFGQLTAQVAIVPVSPALFTVGSNIAAAYVIHVNDSGTTSTPVFTSTSGSISAAPISLTQGKTFLILYGTGFDDATTDNTTVNIQGIAGTVAYAGPQPSIPGLDQMNVLLPQTLAGAGLANVSITVNGVTSNLAEIAIQ